jgi:glucosamine--fructose-6-phosphate aminotransferase (isomerizing)
LCGIVGYIGFRDANKVLIDSLRRLEYRGYDSAGISVMHKDQQIYKEVGEISELEKKLPKIKGTTGIGHTRWATHGSVTKANAHPHLSSNKKIAVVHNGIIENFKKLKEELISKGYKFTSETDSEVFSHLIEDNYKGNLEKAVHAAIKKIQGYYAIVVTCTDEPEKIVGARRESPLIIGVGDNENFLGSDITAFLNFTKRVIYLNDGETCVISSKKVQVFDENNKAVSRKENFIDWDIKDAEKSGFAHFMLKEIYDQPETINKVIRGRISEIERNVSFDESVENLLNNGLESVHIIACGTSYYSGLVGKYFVERLTGIPVNVELSSEYRYYSTRKENALVIAITQSGETLDTIAAIKEARNSGCRTIVITNVVGSTATRIADAHILMQSGPEIGVAATKTFTSQVLVLLLLALKIGKLNQKIGAEDIYHNIVKLKELSRVIRNTLDTNDEIIKISKELKKSHSVFFIGRGINYPLSLEGALKLKEISYIHAEGFAAGELKHGPFALLTKETPVIAIAPKGSTYDKIIANIGEVKARGPKVIAIAEEDDTEIEKHADYVIRIPSKLDILSCFPIIVILQLLAYQVADMRGCSIDKPRNLAKSVTVE